MLTAISAEGDTTCAIDTSGGASCWGLNQDGSVGNGDQTTSIATPSPVTGLQSGVASIAAGFNHGCAVTTTGAGYCWGDDFWGQLGNGVTTGISRTPVRWSRCSR